MAFTRGPLLNKGVGDFTVLTSQTGVTSTGNGVAVDLPAPANGLQLQLAVTSAALVVGDTLDVFVQTRLDGVTWVDVQHFTQALGNGGAKRYTTKLVCNQTVTEFEAGTALAAASHRDLLGDQWLVRWVVAGASPSFTFAVYAVPL